MNNFNLIAPFYDALSKIVFGSSIIESQVYFLSEIKPSDSVLILGGGTGRLLSQMPNCKEIDFVDLSQKMIDCAKKRDCKSPITFIQSDFLSCDFDSIYDIVICSFFLDCFNEQNLKNAISKAKSLLKDDGKLIITDFNSDRTHPFLIKAMHFFFKISAALESKSLQNIQRAISNLDFEETQIENFKDGIFTAIYRKVLRR